MNLQQTILGPVAGLIGAIALLLLAIQVTKVDKPSITVVRIVMFLIGISIVLRVIQLVYPD